MGADWVRRYCISLPHVTEQVQWENDLVFKIGGKMFAIVVLEPSEYCLSLKCSPEAFAELVERPGITPAPYLARANWVALETADALPRSELESLLRDACEMVLANLPKKAQADLRKPPKKLSKAAKKKSPKRAMP